MVFEPVELYASAAVAVAGIVFALLLARHVLKKPAGNDRMQEISKAIQGPPGFVTIAELVCGSTG